MKEMRNYLTISIVC
jgi:uncharacterized protein